MIERYAAYILALGALLGLLGYAWLFFRAWQVRPLWGVSLLCPPLALLFIAKHFRKAQGPVIVLVLAGVALAAPYGLSYYERHFVPLKPYEQMVDGELRITLTGLSDFDYATLQRKPTVVVLQMANPDVTDATLEQLKGLTQLRRLDLSDTRITDEGLARLADLPALRELYLGRTQITDDGFRRHLLPLQTVKKLDLTGTAVTGKTKREWKKLQPDEREYVD